MGKNLHQLYYKDYFSEIKWAGEGYKTDKSNKAEVSEYNKTLTGNHLLFEIPAALKDNPQYRSFQYQVLYPGLVTGIGIGHEASIEGEFKLGVHFDWTWGMPVIYGSSVKGVLRAYFADFYQPTETQPQEKDAKNDIFGCDDKDGTQENKSIYDRDIFFDAVIVKPDRKGRILCSDSITPHPDPLKNPIPITFMKIAPGCTIEFRFKLVDTKIMKDGKEYILTADEKEKLFREILTTVGVGAKTNVGYGQLK